MIGNQYTVSVILPTLNEARNLPLIFPRLPLDVVDEVILVDGRSTDGTVDVARQLFPEVKVVLEPKPGKGAALRAGYRAATGDILVVLDADGSNDPREVPRFVRSLLEGADFVKGSRFAHRGGTTDMPRFRQIGNGAFVLLVNLLFGSAFTDLCYGYHCFWRYCLDAIDVGDVDGFEIDTALYLRAVRQRLRMVEVPSFEGYRFYGIGKLQTFLDGWRVLKTIWREWFAGLRGQPQVDYLGFREQPASWPVLSQAFAGAPSSAAAPLPGTAPLLGTLNAHPPAGARGRRAVLAASAPAPDVARLDLQLLLAASQAVALQSSLRGVLQRALRLALDHTRASSASILVLNEQGRVVEGCLIYHGVYKRLPADTALIRQGLAGWVMSHRRPALVSNTRHDARWLHRAWEQREGKARSAMAVPLIVAGRLVGVLTLVHPRAGHFAADDLEQVAKLVAAEQ